MCVHACLYVYIFTCAYVFVSMFVVCMYFLLVCVLLFVFSVYVQYEIVCVSFCKWWCVYTS